MTLLAEIALVMIAGGGVTVCLSRLPDSRPMRWRRARVAQASRPTQLVALERLVGAAESSAVHAHAYLRPVLVEIASTRLIAHGQALERMPEARGQELLGAGLWEIVRPARPLPEARHSPGVSRDGLTAILDALERL